MLLEPMRESMELVRKSDAEILAVANPIMDRLMAASTAFDYEAHIQDFTERAKASLSKDRFNQVCVAYQADKGLFTEREFVAFFRRPYSIVAVWKQFFQNSPGEHIAEMVLIQDGDRYLVDHVMVF